MIYYSVYFIMYCKILAAVLEYSVIIPRVVKDCRIFLWWYHEWSFAL
jgi:hypothetical protein